MVLAASSSESFSWIGVAIGFAFRFAEGSATTTRGSLEAGDAFLGAGRAGNGGGPYSGGKALKADIRCQKRLRCGEA